MCLVWDIERRTRHIRVTGESMIVSRDGFSVLEDNEDDIEKENESVTALKFSCPHL